MIRSEFLDPRELCGDLRHKRLQESTRYSTRVLYMVASWVFFPRECYLFRLASLLLSASPNGRHSHNCSLNVDSRAFLRAGGTPGMIFLVPTEVCRKRSYLNSYFFTTNPKLPACGMPGLPSIDSTNRTQHSATLALTMIRDDFF